MLREFATTSYPRSRNDRTTPAPIPCEAPVTITVFCLPGTSSSVIFRKAAGTACEPDSSRFDFPAGFCLSLRKFSSGLLRRHVRRVPIRPFRVGLPARLPTGRIVGLAFALLVLAECGFRSAHRAGQIVCGRERRLRRIDAARRPMRDLLNDPRVAIGIFEGHV